MSKNKPSANAAAPRTVWLELRREQACLLARLLRLQAAAYEDWNAPNSPAPEPFTGAHLDLLMPLLPRLEAQGCWG